MAARKPRPAAASGRSARPARSTTSKKPATRASAKEADAPAEEGGGIGWEGGIGIITFLMIVAAILVMDHRLGTDYPGRGIFFGNQ